MKTQCIYFSLWLPLMGCLNSSPPSVSTEENPEIELEWETSEDGGCSDSWVYRYALYGIVDVTDTPLGMGDDSASVGGLAADELVIRFADNDGSPAVGQAIITDYHITQHFTIVMNMLGELSIETDLVAHTSDECGVASGTFDSHSIEWDVCEYGTGYGTTSWTPDQGAVGAGCLREYHVTGAITCEDDSLAGGCSDGWLEDGPNVQDYSYQQPLLAFEFTGDNLENFTMSGIQYGTEIPTYSNNRTWLTLQGRLVSATLEPTPDCLCK